MTKEQMDIIKDHGPYKMRDGELVDANGVALASLVPEGGEVCDWDVALVAALNAVHFGLLG